MPAEKSPIRPKVRTYVKGCGECDVRSVDGFIACRKHRSQEEWTYFESLRRVAPVADESLLARPATFLSAGEQE